MTKTLGLNIALPCKKFDSVISGESFFWGAAQNPRFSIWKGFEIFLLSPLQDVIPVGTAKYARNIGLIEYAYNVQDYLLGKDSLTSFTKGN